MENIDFSDNSFDGVWAYTSLLHVPKKNLQQVLATIKRILKPQGVFYVGMKEGNFEGLLESDKCPGKPRFLSLYFNDELQRLLGEHFSVIHTSKVSLEDAVFLNYLCKNDLP